jgi:hypothetical protein
MHTNRSKMNLKNSRKPESTSIEENAQTTADSLVIEERADGSFSIDWDPNDPKWSWMNGLSEEEVAQFVHDAIENFLDKENV